MRNNDATKQAPAGASPLNRPRRLLQGWSANLLQMGLGMTQQVALVPVFLHFWTSDTLAAWLTIYAAGNLILVADCGLQVRAINKFLALRSSTDCDRRTAQFFAAMFRIYLGLLGTLFVLLLAAILVFPPSASLGFAAVPDFDLAFAVMVLGLLLAVAGNPAAALYRARGHYARAVGLQCVGMLAAQLGQLAAVAMGGSLLAVASVYVIAQLAVLVYVIGIDAPFLYPFLRRASGSRAWRSWSWHWVIGQFRLAFPFAVAGATDLVLANAPVLLVSAFVSDRMAVAQWGLTRVVAGLLRGLCLQTTLPLAAELGHDHAVGETDKLQSLYARGSILVTALASLVASGLLAFWADFFSIWTRGAIPYDQSLSMTLLVGTAVAAPSILAASYASYSDRGKLLASAKSLQLVVFMILSFSLIPWLGPLGVAIALVSSDVLVQLGWLTRLILRQTLKHPLEHALILASLVAAVMLVGWSLGLVVRDIAPGAGLSHFAGECALWLLVIGVLAGPLWIGGVRDRLSAAIPR
jgi:O-antigen/teichoic acid export membrane protein